MISFDLTPVRHHPMDHVMVEDYLPPDIYAGMRDSFPECPRRDGPTGYTSFWGDPDYDSLIAEHPAWRHAFDRFQSQDFVDWCLAQFGEEFARHGCTLDLSKASYVPYAETRENKQKRHIEGPKPDPEQLWVRMDILQGRVDYSRRVHLDHRRRLVSLLIYLCDGDELQMEGGDLVLHGVPEGELGPEPVTVRPRHNLMVAFPCSQHSWHSVPKATRQNAYRNFVQVALSSSVDAWPE